MVLTDEERRFLSRRERLVAAWRFAGPALLALSIGLGAWLFWFRPLLANPFVVTGGLVRGEVAASTVALMAGLLPVVVLTCLVLTVAVVLFAYAAFSNERRYLEILRREARDAGSDESGATRTESRRG